MVRPNREAVRRNVRAWVAVAEEAVAVACNALFPNACGLFRAVLVPNACALFRGNICRGLCLGQGGICL